MTSTELLLKTLRTARNETLGSNVPVFERFCNKLDDHYLVLKSHTLKDTKRNILREKGDVFEDLCYETLRAGAFNLPLTYLWKFKDIPDNIRSGLGLSDRDMGIDLVGCTATHWIAFQCKYRKKPNKAKRPDGQFNKWQVPWSELSTFLALANNNNFGQLVVMTSARGVNWQGNPNARCKVLARETFLGISRDIWDKICGDAGYKLGNVNPVKDISTTNPSLVANVASGAHTNITVRAARNAWLDKLDKLNDQSTKQ
jgi:hypothetical protein